MGGRVGVFTFAKKEPRVLEVCFWVDAGARSVSCSTQNTLGFLELLKQGGVERGASRMGAKCRCAGKGGPLLVAIANF